MSGRCHSLSNEESVPWMSGTEMMHSPWWEDMRSWPTSLQPWLERVNPCEHFLMFSLKLDFEFAVLSRLCTSLKTFLVTISCVSWNVSKVSNCLDQFGDSKVKTLNSCNFGVYQTDHEDANGQFEINWHYQACLPGVCHVRHHGWRLPSVCVKDCLTTADQHVFFKWAVKTLSERHGFRVPWQRICT